MASPFHIPKSGETITKGPARASLSERVLQRAQKNRAQLDFMIEKKKGGGEALYNKRSTLPAPTKIVAFNRAREQSWSLGKSADMRTESERAWSKAAKPSLKGLNLSRNHKIPDHLLGTLINQTVISGVLDDKKTAKAHRDSLLRFGGKEMKPLASAARKEAFERFKDEVGALSSGALTRKSYQKHFNAAKRILSANPANLRLGVSPVNSGIGESLDLNAARRKGTIARPPTPISEHMSDALDEHLHATGAGGVGGLFPTSHGGRVTSSMTDW